MATGELHFTLRQLEYFVAVAETGSISGAAALCHVSQPGLSLALGQLEDSLGVTLFVRSRSKGTSLTPAGVELVDRARHLLADSARFQLEAERESGGVVGRLNIGCYTTLSPSFVPQMLHGFGNRFPGVSLDFTERPQPELQDMLHAGEIELAIMYAHQLDTTLEHMVVQSFRPYVLLPESHRLAGDEPVSLADLADDPMILFDVPPSRANWEGLMTHVPIEPAIAHRTQNFELVRCLVGRGMGYSVLFQRPLVDVTYAGDRIVCHEIAENVPPTDVVLAHPAGVQLTARASLFMQYVGAEFAPGKTSGAS
ncbi:MAG TPA: LysR family transcriptional regulator [Ilumatobacter sp.]|nr:LysR family transcriptional regulator [Ilumatobacter sp.]